MNAKVDRLSSLSDDLIRKILYYNDTKDAIKTSILSSRWKNTWKSTSHLDLPAYHDSLLPKFYESINGVLLSRNNEIELSSVKLSLSENVSQAFVKKIMNYVFSHNVQNMTIILCNSEFPPSPFISQSLKNLTLVGGSYRIRIKSTWNLLALTTLHLDHVELSNENSHDESGGLFSKCPNLKNLTLTSCEIYPDSFIISHSKLSNLTLEDVDCYDVFNVDAPHLKDLTINFKEAFVWDLVISAPELTSLVYASKSYFEFSVDDLSSLKKVDFYISNPKEEDASNIIDLLQQFHNVKYLTLGLEIIEVLASCVELFSHLTSPFANLTSFVIYPATLYKLHSREETPTLIYLPDKIYSFDLYNLSREVRKYLVDDLLGKAENYLLDISLPYTKLTRFMIYQANLHSEEESQKKINMPSEVKNYLLDGSSSATITIFSREEVLELQNALLNAVFAPKIMDKLQKLLENEKLSCETISTHADNIKAPMDRHDADTNVLGETQISEISKGWDDVSRQIKQGKEKIDDIFSMLDLIEFTLKLLPASRKDRLHACFSSLRAEAYNVTKLISVCMKIKCEEKMYGFMNLL